MIVSIGLFLWNYLFRFAIAALSMATLLALMIICLIFVGGAGGWISFIIASCVILGVAIAALASTNATSKQP